MQYLIITIIAGFMIYGQISEYIRRKEAFSEIEGEISEEEEPKIRYVHELGRKSC